MLETRNLVRRFGGVVAVDGVSLRVGEGVVHGLIGPNGAGKSTLFHLITGHLRPTAGQVVFDGQDVTDLPPHRRTLLRIAIAFQAVRLFRGMTVLENVMVGAHAQTSAGFAEAMLRVGRHHRDEALIRERAEAALARVGLSGEGSRPAESLPLGRQRTVQVARALCAAPRLLLLDEPATGLRGFERERFAELLRSLRTQGLTMLLVEHDVAFVTALADVVTVMDAGRVIAEGPPDEIRRDPRVIGAYLGEEAREAS
ncbi:MAG TPA: ABC transporter ATP-binding protein [Candidatus Dormibacteraeota bacterium]